MPVVIVLLTLRNGIRLFDFEKSKAKMVPGNWCWLMGTQSMFIIMNFCLLQFLLPNTMSSYLVSAFIASFIVLSLYLGANRSYDVRTLELERYIPQFIVGMISFSVLVTCTFRKVQNQLLDDLIQKFEKQNEFRIILNNLEEAIMVFSTKSIEFVNDKFLQEFHS